MSSSTNSSNLTSVGLLVLRVAMGALMLVHGIPKLLAFSELAGKFPDPLGMGSQLSLIAAVGAEVGCSILLILGLGTRVALVPLMVTMAVALFVVHGNDPWKDKELAALFLSVYASLLIAGPGQYSLDHRICQRRKGTEPQPTVATT